MEEKIKVSNKIISIETIKKIAVYLQKQCETYGMLIKKDKLRNEPLNYNDRKYEYEGNDPYINYTIETLNGKIMTERNYDWFLNMLEDNKNIKHIRIYQYISFSATGNNVGEYIFKHLSTDIDFYEDRVNIIVDGKELESEVQKTYSNLRDILDSCIVKYDKTIKNRKIRMQSFYISTGLIFAYIAMILLYLNIDKISEIVMEYVMNKYVLVGAHLAIAIIIGNLFGSIYMNKLYEYLLPERKYSHYNESSRKNIYIDNIEEYIEKNEVQIGKFYNSIKRRNEVEAVYKVTRLIVLIQVAIYIIYIMSN